MAYQQSSRLWVQVEKNYSVHARSIHKWRLKIFLASMIIPIEKKQGLKEPKNVYGIEQSV